jgi:hypothetical protein
MAYFPESEMMMMDFLTVVGCVSGFVVYYSVIVLNFITTGDIFYV